MNLSQLFQNENGDTSSMRSIMLVVAAYILVKAVAFNFMALIHGAPPVPFDQTDVYMLLAVAGPKAAQSFAENKKAGV